MPSGAGPAAAPQIDTGRMSLTDRVSGGPIWSGFIIGFAAWILFEIILVAAGLTGIRAGQGANLQPSDWWWSFGAGLIALFIGGLIAGSASRWHTVGSGAMQGLTVWALTIVALLVLGAVGAGIGFGAFSDAVGASSGVNGNSTAALATAKDAATAAIVLVAASAVTAVIGGILGARIAGSVVGRSQATMTAGSPRR